MGITHSGSLTISDDLIVGGSISMSGDYLDAPTSASAPSTPNTGMMYYDTTLEKFRVYQTSGWSNVDGTAAGSLDGAYNGGAAITVDGGAVTLNDANTDTQGTLLIDKSGAVTGSDSANLVYIYSDGAHDTTGTVNLLKLNMGTETASTPQGIDVTMNANSDNAIILTKGAFEMTDGAVTLTSGALTMDSGNFTMSAGNADITGTLTVSDVAALEEITASGAVTIEGVTIIDGDNATQFLIRENGDAADVLTVDTTQDAGDTTMLLTTKVTTGTGFHIDGSTITTGDALKITVAAATMGATGAALSVVADGSEVFAIRDDGSGTSIAGTAEGTDALTLTLGDQTISDGDLTLSGGELSVTDGVTTSGSGIKLTSSMTTAGAATGTAGALTIIAAAATTGTIFSIVADAVTSGDMVYLDNGGGTLNGGFYINCNDDNASDFTVGDGGATVIAGAAAGTTALTLSLGDLVITDTDASTISSANGTGTLLTLDNVAGVIASDTAVLSLDAGGAVASGGNILRVAPTGTPNAGAIGIEFVGSGKTCQALYIDGDSTGVDVAHIHGGGALTNGFAVLGLTNDGTLGTGSSLLNLTVGGTPHAAAIAMELVASKDCQALVIATSAATDSAVEIAGAGAVADNKALLELNWTSTPAAAGSNMLRVDGSGGTNAAKPTLVEIVDTGVSTCLTASSAPVANNVVTFTGTGALTNGFAVLHVTSSGALATGGNTLKVSTTGAPASGAIYTEIDYSGVTDTNENVGVHINATSKKVQALVIDAAPLAGSAALITTTGALAADKASLEVVANVTGSNADSSVVRVNQEHTTGASFVMTLKQDDLDVGFINFEGTASADANSPISTHGTTGGTTDFVRCAINGAKFWIPGSTSDPTA